MAYQEQDGIPRSPGLHSIRLQLSDGRRVQGTTKPASGCTRTWSRYSRNGRISEASLDRSKTWQRTKRRSASDLLLLPRRTTNLASDLTPKERQALKGAIEIELRARQASKLAKQRKSRR